MCILFRNAEEVAPWVFWERILWYPPIVLYLYYNIVADHILSSYTLRRVSSYHIESYCVYRTLLYRISYGIISYRTSSRFIIVYRFISQPIVSYRTIPYHFVYHRTVVRYYTVSYITSYCIIISYPIIPFHLMSYHIASYRCILSFIIFSSWIVWYRIVYHRTISNLVSITLSYIVYHLIIPYVSHCSRNTMLPLFMYVTKYIPACIKC